MQFLQNQGKNHHFSIRFEIQQAGDLATQCDPERQAASVCHRPLVTNSVFTTEEWPSHTHTGWHSCPVTVTHHLELVRKKKREIPKHFRRKHSWRSKCSSFLHHCLPPPSPWLGPALTTVITLTLWQHHYTLVTCWQNREKDPSRSRRTTALKRLKS